jgi:uncharacterized protein (TIGR00255 family)
MVKSMTGYGKREFEWGTKRFTLEIKTLNSKQLDINTRIPPIYREKDLVIRKELSEKLIRGKVDFTLYMENMGDESNATINETVLVHYFQQLKKISENLGLPVNESTLVNAMRLPETVRTKAEELDEQEWQEIMKNIQETLHALDSFRIQEGHALARDMHENNIAIGNLLDTIQPFEKNRIETIKNRIRDSLASLKINGTIDDNRFEQELIFYTEKLDINEEKVRLRNHLSYFDEVLNAPESEGKKLGFISQEIGREINTIGSKANNSDIQRIVVQMKDHLERMKEQIMNIL